MGMGNEWLAEQGLISLPKRSADNFAQQNSDRRERFTNNGAEYIIRLLSRTVPFEPPDAQVRLSDRVLTGQWCGEGELNTPLYPIIGVYEPFLCGHYFLTENYVSLCSRVVKFVIL
jgi:hypothetical protein